MLNLIKYIHKNMKKYYMDIIKKTTCDFYVVLWKKLKELSEVNIKDSVEKNQEKNSQLRQFYLLTKKSGLQQKIHK